MHLPIQSKPVQRKRSYSLGNKTPFIHMSDDGMDDYDDDEMEGNGDEDGDDEMEDLSDDEGGDDE